MHGERRPLRSPHAPLRDAAAARHIHRAVDDRPACRLHLARHGVRVGHEHVREPVGFSGRGGRARIDAADLQFFPPRRLKVRYVPCGPISMDSNSSHPNKTLHRNDLRRGPAQLGVQLMHQDKLLPRVGVSVAPSPPGAG